MSEYEGKYDRRLLARCRELEEQLAEATSLLKYAMPVHDHATLRCGTKVSRDEYLRLHGQKEAINQALNSIDNQAMESVVLPVSLKYIHLSVLDIVEMLYKQLEEVCDLIEEVEHTAEFRDWEH